MNVRRRPSEFVTRLLPLVVILLAGFAAAVSAEQSKSRSEGTIISPAPMVWLVADNRTPIVVLQTGTPVEILGREGPWLRVLVHDEDGPDKLGYVSPFDVKVTQDAAEPSGTLAGGEVSQRGFIEARFTGFPQAAPNDSVRLMGEVLLREDVFASPKKWLRLAGGVDLRGNSHDQVDQRSLGFDDRTALRPLAALHRLTIGVTTRHFSLDAGKQFVRWGRADIVSPTDRFAPRDYLDVVNTEFLPVTGIHTSTTWAGETLEAMWVPRMTPSRLPLFDQRWTVLPAEAQNFVVQDRGLILPKTSDVGVRWSHTGRFEAGLSFFDGHNHLANLTASVDPLNGVIGLLRTYPRIRTYGGELAVSTPAFNIKSEAAYFTAPAADASEYVLYVVEMERQAGEWLLDAGYAGEVVTKARPVISFAAEEGMARSLVGRASYTIDARRSVTIESAVRQNGHGFYGKGEYSQALAQHWRLTLTGVAIGGKADDFLGQYRRNGQLSVAFRLSF